MTVAWAWRGVVVVAAIWKPPTPLAVDVGDFLSVPPETSACMPESCAEFLPVLKQASALTGSPSATTAFSELLGLNAARQCPLAALLLKLGRLYFAGQADGFSFRQFTAHLEGCDLSEEAFFKVLGLSRPQMAYAFWLLSGSFAPLPAWLAPESTPRSRREAGVVFDFGTNRGYDSAFYTALNFSAVAVDAHPRTQRLLISRLRSAQRHKRLIVVHSALVGEGEPDSVPFYQCNEDTRSTTDPSLGMDANWCAQAQVEHVQTTTCGSLSQRFGPAHFAKIDVEGADHTCLETLLRTGSSLPRFISVELPVGHAGRVDVTAGEQLLALLTSAGYMHFKLARQGLFNPPFWGGRLGGSGPFGDAATDWQVGLQWRSASAVAADLAQIARLRVEEGALVAEWFDLHAALPGQHKALGLCLSGHLRGLNQLGVERWQHLVLRGFPSLDTFAVVPLEDCVAAERLLGGPPVAATLHCVDSQSIPEEEVHWLQKGPRTDPDVCDARACGYVWRDAAYCASMMRRHMQRHRVSYWRIARSRIDLYWERFPEDPMQAFADDAIIWSYAIPDGQWIAMPDRFAIGHPTKMLDAYFGTYAWMLDPRSWRYYRASSVPVCIRRGHLEVLGYKDGQPLLEVHGKVWACPEHSARKLAITGPEAVLESRMRLHNVAVRLRPDICFNHLAGRPGRIQDSVCESQAKTHENGYWLNDWEESRFSEDEFTAFLRKTCGVEGSEKLESGLYTHDGIFAAQLASFLLDEWKRLGRPPRTVDLGAGRGALVEQLDRWLLPVVGVDGNRIIEFTLRDKGLWADLATEISLGKQKRRGVLRSWIGGLSSGDWAISLGVGQWIPPARNKHFHQNLQACGREGLIISWPSVGGRNARPEAEVVASMEDLGYSLDRSASGELRRSGGLLCCPTHREVLVFRRRSARPQQPCDASLLLMEHDDSKPCLFKRSFGCVEGGVWTHMGCSGTFSSCVGDVRRVVDCSSKRHSYTECAWGGAEHARCRLYNQSAGLPRFQDEVPSAAARLLSRSDLVLEPQRQGEGWFATLFGMPLSYLFDSMDPLTAVQGAVWSADRTLTLATLKAFKLTVLEGVALDVEARRWDREWPLHHKALTRWAARSLSKSPLPGAVRFRLLVSSLRVAAAHVQSRTAARCATRPPARARAAIAWTGLQTLRLNGTCTQARLAAWQFGVHRGIPPTQQPVRFVQDRHSRRWVPRFRFSSPLAQYLYRVAYRAPGYDWAGEA